MIGSALTHFLEESGYQVYSLSRSNQAADFFYDQAQGRMVFNDELPLYGVVNLAGANISSKRWNEKRKQEILTSRELTTKLLSEKLASMESKPEVFLSASAIGFYGPTGDGYATESSPAGDDFLAEVSKRWEGATLAATVAGIRTAHMRFGIVLSVKGGVLQNFLLPFRLAVVGPVGSGKQKISWISINDALRLVEFGLNNESLSGPINCVSNNAVTSAEFAKALSRAANRPHLPALPAFMARLMFGEMADAALLASSDVRSKKYDDLTFDLQHQDLESTLKQLLDTNT